jgi:hypothetical protein
MAGDGNAGLILLQRRVLLEMFDQKKVLPTLILSRCGTFVSCGNIAYIRPIVHTKAVKTSKKSLAVH